MLKLTGLLKLWPGTAMAVFLLVHGALAALAPCPWLRDDQAADAVTLISHNAHRHKSETDVDLELPRELQASAPSPQSCPFDLMHALYGVLKPVPPSIHPVTLISAIMVSVVCPPLVSRVAVIERLDPPPRFG